MTQAASLAPDIADTPQSVISTLLQCFAIQFEPFFKPGRPRLFSRALHAKGAAFLRGLEAIVRRIVMIRAAELVPRLPPAAAPDTKTGDAKAADASKAYAGPTDAPPALPAPEPKPRPVAQFAPLPFFHKANPVRTPSARPAPATTKPRQRAGLIDVCGLMRRHNTLVRLCHDAEPMALRVAHRLRAMQAKHGLIRFLRRPGERLHPDHVPFLKRFIDIFTLDANDVLLALYERDPRAPDSS